MTIKQLLLIVIFDIKTKNIKKIKKMSQYFSQGNKFKNI